ATAAAPTRLARTVPLAVARWRAVVAVAVAAAAGTVGAPGASPRALFALGERLVLAAAQQSSLTRGEILTGATLQAGMTLAAGLGVLAIDTRGLCVGDRREREQRERSRRQDLASMTSDQISLPGASVRRSARR